MFNTFHKVKDIIDFVNYVEVKTKKNEILFNVKIKT